MVSLNVIFTILLFHWIADFLLQSDEDAKGKSTNNYHLINHTLTYSLFWLIPMAMMLDSLLLANVFMIITFITHTITDYFTSKWNSALWYNKDSHNFFCSIGMDQVLHYVQLILTYYFLCQIS